MDKINTVTRYSIRDRFFYEIRWYHEQFVLWMLLVFIFREEIIMNRFMFYLDSFLGTVGKGISYITHHGQYKMKDTERPFRIGKGNWAMWLIAGLGFCGSLLAFVLSFIPPDQIATGSNTVWFSVLIIGCIVVVGAPFVIYASRKPSWKDPDAAQHFAPFHWEVPAATATSAQSAPTPASAQSRQQNSKPSDNIKPENDKPKK